MKSPKEMVLEILSKIDKQEIINKLKSAGIDQDNINIILEMTKSDADNK